MVSISLHIHLLKRLVHHHLFLLLRLVLDYFVSHRIQVESVVSVCLRWLHLW